MLAIRATGDRLSDGMREVKDRPGIRDRQYASISIRLDPLDGRVLRIEKRLDPVEA